MGKKHSYGVVFDAGSSGTRVYVYEYKKASYVRDYEDEDDREEELGQLPHVKTKKDWNFKVHPGISTFGEAPERVGEEHLKELVDFALDVVPSSEEEYTPIFLLATAGMRLLPKDQSAALLEKTCAYFRQRTKFLLPDCDAHIQVIPGETEGLYGWIAANYLLGGFDEGEKQEIKKKHHTYGFLDMGGASAQIAFAPNVTEASKHAEDLKLLRLRKVNGEAVDYRVFVTTWLGFGANEARRRYVDALLKIYPGQREVPDPCLPSGIIVTQYGDELETGSPGMQDFRPRLIGTGAFAECLQATFPLLEKDEACDNPPCLLNGVHTPAIDFGVNHFVGVSEYWHTTHEIFAMAHKDRAYDFATYQKQVTEFCSRDWDDIREDVDEELWGDKVDEKTVEEVCFKASWLINMLHEGIGIPRVGLETSKAAYSGIYANKTQEMVSSAKDRGFLDPFQAVHKVDGTEVSWTLGKMVLYASSQMPPAAGALAVGFGSNKPGATDFQRPSVEFASSTPGQSSPSYSAQPSNSSSSSSDAKAWSSSPLSSSYSRRVPGIFIFLLILILAIYLLSGRERRKTWNSKLSSLMPSNSRRRGGGGGTGGGKFSSLLSSTKFFLKSNEPYYDRLAEEGQYTDDVNNASLSQPHDFELADLDSDSSASSSLASASSSSALHSSERPPLRTGRSSGLVTSGLGLEGGSAGAGNGLVVRVESRENLAIPGANGGGAGVGGGSGMVGPAGMLRRQSSRPGSPMRRPGGLGTWKESVD